MEEKIYYIYAWYREDTNTIFYIGKGKGNRYKKTQNRSPHFTNIINTTETHVKILKEGLTESEALEEEKNMINNLVKNEGYSIEVPEYKGKRQIKHLVNQTWGGEGTSGFTFEMPKEAVAKRVEKTIGQKRTEEQKENMKEASKKRFEEHPEQLDAFRKSRIGFKTSDKTKEILRQQHLGKTLTDEHKQKISEGVKSILTEEMHEKRNKRTIEAIGVKIYCVELDMTFSCYTELQKYFKENYNETINVTQLKAYLNGKTKKGWYKKIEINGVMTELHWERLN